MLLWRARVRRACGTPTAPTIPDSRQAVAKVTVAGTRFGHRHWWPRVLSMRVRVSFDGNGATSGSTRKLTIKLTNTSSQVVHLFTVQAYAVQSGYESSGGFAYAPGEGFDKTVAPGASTEVTFGSDDWGAQWNSLVRSYYYEGYAE